jgi:beta-galactosidase
MKQFDISVLADPEIFEIGALPPHASLRYEDRDEISLDGEWKFHYAEHLGGRPEGFEKNDCSCDGWDTVNTPGHIQLSGYGTPQYVNTQYPWDGWEDIVPGRIPERFNPVGSYARLVTIAKTSRYFIRFDGVESAFALWVNGIFVGYSEDSFTPTTFDLDGLLHIGENKIAVQVYRFSSGSWLEGQDFWRFSGIFRSVTLYAVPPLHLFDLDVKATLDETLTLGEITVRATVLGKVSGHISFSVAGKTVEAELLTNTIELYLSVSEPKLWSAEEPNLYAYTLSIDGETVHGHLGFRRFEMKDGIMTLNGKRLVLKGVNRHEWNCGSGRAITAEETETDILNCKRNNINAIRTSHYPNRTEFYDLCDRYGIYVIDECNIETHGSWMIDGEARPNDKTIPADRDEWREITLARAGNLYGRDKNHPCVLIWSCGNESFGGRNLFLVSEYFRKTDPYRLVHYEGVFHDRSYPDTSDMESQMYTPAAEVESFLRDHSEKPFILCEYSHAMGNSVGGLGEYTELAEREPRYQGGFIWDYIDQAILWDGCLRYGGDFGDRPTDYNFSCDGLVFADRRNSPKMREVKAAYQNFRFEFSDENVTVLNKNLFLGTDNLSLVINGKSRDIDIPAGEKRRFRIPKTGIVTVRLLLKRDEAWAKSGHEVAFGQRRRPGEQAIESGVGTGADGEAAIRTEGDVNVGYRSGSAGYMIRKSDGALVSARADGKECLLRPAVPNFWRAPVENDYGWNMPQLMGRWRYAPDGATRVDYECVGASLRVTLTYLGEPAEVPEFGMLFVLPKELRFVSYDGYGPHENTADRRLAAEWGRFEFESADNVTPYVFPQESGSRTGVDRLDVTDASGRGLRFSGDDMTVTVTPYLPQEVENACHIEELPPVVKTVVRVAEKQMGVGGDDSWGARPLPKYRVLLRPGDEFRFSVSPIIPDITGQR